MNRRNLNSIFMLSRPKIRLRKLFLKSMFFLFSVQTVIFFLFFYLANFDLDDFISHFTLFIKISLYIYIALILVFANKIIVAGILIYQCYAKDSVRLRCCFYPSCSHYALIALNKYFWCIALFKIFIRLRKCGKQGGIDFP